MAAKKKQRDNKSAQSPPTAGETQPSVISTQSDARPAAQGARLPERFGRYRIVRRLGQGAMGDVYLAEDTQLQRQVALKVPKLELENKNLLERFYREARAAAGLQHRNICPVFDVGEIDGVHFLTMAYIEGRSLSAYVKPGKPLPVRSAVAIVRKLSLALSKAHGRGILHRDLKPSNVMIDADKQPVVMDFGLARKVDAEESRLTQTGSLVGTPAYMPPEQVKGELDELGPCSDVYSLGIIFYELLTGQVPYEGPIASVLGQILAVDAQPPSVHRKNLDPALEAICLKAMAKPIEERYASMTELATALTGWLKGLPGQRTEQLEEAAAEALPVPQDEDETLVPSEANMDHLFASLVDDEPPGMLDRVRKRGRKSSGRKSRKPAKPSNALMGLWNRIPAQNRWIVTTVAGGALALLLGVIIIIKTKDGTVEIDTKGKDVKITLDGDNDGVEPNRDPEEADYYASLPVGRPEKLAFCNDRFQGCPAISSDGLELFFQGIDASGPGNEDIFVARRKALSEPFNKFAPLRMACSKEHEYGPFVSSDGLALYFASARVIPPSNPRLKHRHIYVAKRSQKGHEFGEAQLISELATRQYDTRPVASPNKNSLVFNSSGVFGSTGKTFYASRSDDNTTFQVSSTNLPSPTFPVALGDNGSLIFAETDSGEIDKGLASLYATWTTAGPDNYVDPVHITDIGNGSWNVGASLTADARVLFYRSGLDVFAMRLSDETAERIREVLDWKPGLPRPWQANTDSAANSNDQEPQLALAPFSADEAKQHQEAWAKHLGVPVETTNSIDMKLRLIPPGEFMMGSSEDEIKLLKNKDANDLGLSQDQVDAITGEGPQHRIRITRPFYLGSTEVTHEQWKAVMGTNPWLDEKGKKRDYVEEGPDFPATHVGWSEVVQFCRRLGENEGIEGVTYRLPTEAEWEYACRAGSQERHFYGNTQKHAAYAWYSENKVKKWMRPVGKKKPNPFGLYDMYGNVWEHCYDWLSMDYYSQSPVDDPQGPETGIRRVSRGGDWYNNHLVQRSANRGVLIHKERSEQGWQTLGFRIVRTTDAEVKRPVPVKSIDLSKAKVLFQDEFDDPKSGFPIGEFKNARTRGYRDGKYFIGYVRGKRRFLCNKFDTPYSVPSDFACEIVGRLGEPCKNWALHVHSKDRQHAVSFAINREGELSVGPNLGVQGPASQTFAHPAIKKGSEFNTLLVTVRNGKTSAFVNGEAICTDIAVSDELTPANLLFSICSHQLQATTVEFERMTVWSLDPVQSLGPSTLQKKPAPTKTVGRPGEEIAQRRQEYLDKYLVPLMEDKVRIKDESDRWLPPLNLGKRMNVDRSWMPALSPDGKELYYGVWRTRAGDAYKPPDIHRSLWRGDRWSDPIPVLAGNTQLTSGPIRISNDGRIMALCSGTISFPNEPNYGRSDVYIATRQGDTWSKPKNAGRALKTSERDDSEEWGVGFVRESDAICYSSGRQLWTSEKTSKGWQDPKTMGLQEATHPCFGPLGDQLYFVSRREGGFGGEDIWMVERTGDGWSRPSNLGNVVNGGGDECHPAFSRDGSIMYYCSCCPWNLRVTGKAESEVAIRHMAEIYALGEAEIPGPSVAAPSLEDAKSISDVVTTLPTAAATTKTPTTPKPDEQWQSLFNGKDLTGWQPMHSSGPREVNHETSQGGWTVEKGVLICSTDEPGWLKSDQQYEDFELQLEYRLIPGGNSGLLFRTPDRGQLGYVGMEIQIQDDAAIHARSPQEPNQHSGGIYRAVSPKLNATKPPGTWNRLVARCRGDDVIVTLNNKQVVSVDMKTVTTLKDRPRAGYLGLYNFAGLAKGTAFRNIRMRKLK